MYKLRIKKVNFISLPGQKTDMFDPSNVSNLCWDFCLLLVGLHDWRDKRRRDGHN